MLRGTRRLFAPLERFPAKGCPLSASMRDQLSRDLRDADPWVLEGNPYERRRYDVMLGTLADGRTYYRALEVGCATGVFTAALSMRCETLHVIDAMPEAIDRCRRRLGERRNVTYSVADVGDWGGCGETYDLIVAAEVLYYLGSRKHIRSAVRRLVNWLKPGGILLFSSMVDTVAARARLIGAESTIRDCKRFLEEIARCSCHGSGPDEHAFVVKFERRAKAA